MYTPIKKNIAIQNGPFEDVFPIKTWGIFQPAMLVYQRVFTNLFVFFFAGATLTDHTMNLVC